MRRNLTPSEKGVWELIRRKSLGVKVHRQKIILGYIVDFWVPSEALAIEIDGPYHNISKQKEWDKQRDQALAAIGIHTLRFSSHLRPSQIASGIKQELLNRRPQIPENSK
jgi:very-short-patch-repair endonuclease